jgi:hypothetical protein
MDFSDLSLDQKATAVSVSIVAIAVFLIQLAMAIGVGADAADRVRKAKSLAFFGPGLWFLITWIGGLLALAVYWTIHYSTLRHTEDFPSR